MDNSKKCRRKLSKVAAAIFLVFLAATVTCVIILAVRISEYSKENINLDETRKAVRSKMLTRPMDFPLVSPTYKPEDLIDISSSNSDNPDLFAYIVSEDGLLDYPVMKCIDSEKYMERDYFGEASEYGCIFVDNASVFDGSKNMILEGHHMKNEKMFGRIDKYLDKRYGLDNGQIKLITDDAIKVYMVCGGMLYSADDYDTIKHMTYFTESGFDDFKDMLLNQGDIYRDFSYQDELLTLATCEYSQENGRLIIVAKLVDHFDFR